MYRVYSTAITVSVKGMETFKLIFSTETLMRSNIVLIHCEIHQGLGKKNYCRTWEQDENKDHKMDIYCFKVSLQNWFGADLKKKNSIKMQRNSLYNVCVCVVIKLNSCVLLQAYLFYTE